jgi:hypothetical protein
MIILLPELKSAEIASLNRLKLNHTMKKGKHLAIYKKC